MKENLLHFIWKLKLFPVKTLCTSQGEKLEIVSSGLPNFNAGPDFLTAKIRVNGQLWVGNVEIHVNASDWYAHGHENDKNYDAVILHVVWNDNMEIFRNSNKPLTTLALKKYVSKNVLDKYRKLMLKDEKWILCENQLGTVSKFHLSNWLEKLYYERLEKKSKIITSLLAFNKNNWEATLFCLLAKNFGLKINGEAFFDMAKSINFSVIRKISCNPFQLEALLFGQAGLLIDQYESDYFKKLQNEYNYLKNKFKLQPVFKKQVDFFRLRPNNFPTIRLSQFANLIYKEQHLFSKVLETKNIKNYYELLSVKTSAYWETHYTFGKSSKKTIKKTSKKFIDLLVINTIIPLKFIYHKHNGNVNLMGNVIDMTIHMKPEKNAILSKFESLQVASNNLFESQALLELKNEYCNNQKCLQCAIGKELITS